MTCGDGQGGGLGFSGVCAVREFIVKFVVVEVLAMYRMFIKRFLDILLSLAAIIILSPVLAVLAVLVRVKLGSPILFRQERPGKNGKIFMLYKFRTMTDACGDDGRLLADDIRLTKFGRLLRSTSLDELPELFNILKGDMSIIGPRPLLVAYLPLYSEEQSRRHEVRPGLSGWAQVHGRNALEWEEKFSLDVYYVDHLSFLMDAKIIFTTIIKVFRRDGISQQGEATVQAFTGSGNVLVNESCEDHAGLN